MVEVLHSLGTPISKSLNDEIEKTLLNS